MTRGQLPKSIKRNKPRRGRVPNPLTAAMAVSNDREFYPDIDPIADLHEGYLAQNPHYRAFTDELLEIDPDVRFLPFSLARLVFTHGLELGEGAKLRRTELAALTQISKQLRIIVEGGYTKRLEFCSRGKSTYASDREFALQLEGVTAAIPKYIQRASGLLKAGGEGTGSGSKYNIAFMRELSLFVSVAQTIAMDLAEMAKKLIQILHPKSIKPPDHRPFERRMKTAAKQFPIG